MKAGPDPALKKEVFSEISENASFQQYTFIT